MGKALSLLLAAASMVALWSPSPAADTLRIDDRKLAELEFSVPSNPKESKYLGLSTRDKFRIGQIKARIVLVEIFSMYCPICQAEAAKVNEIYRLVEADPSLKDTVRLLGVGTGNTPFEVDVFRKQFQIPFPLVPDEDLSIQKASSAQIRTPVFLVVKIHDGGKIGVLDVHVGKIDNAAEYVKGLSALSGRK